MEEKILLGTYTKRESKGIYQVILDTDKKTLSDVSFVQAEGSPTYLGTSSDDFLYAVSKDDTAGGMAAYKKLADGSYELINKVMAEGAPPCYVGIDNQRQLVYDANYHKGSLHVYKKNQDGSLTLVDTVQHSGNGPHENQAGPRAHYADLTPDKRLVACDLGTDGVYVYDVSDEGKLTEVSVFQTAPGTGPRHIVFHPSGNTAYIIGELNNTVTSVAYNQDTGAFSYLQTISILPEGFTEFSGAGAIRISQDGKFVYASNRGHNSIAVIALDDSDEKMSVVQIISSEGDFPRDFALNSTDELVVVAHQESDNLTLFERDDSTGKLTLLQKDVFAPEGVCTYFL
ncbi:lactonase family protein [Vagococcus elongatus]|uniref:6-phosphogluconolactonase n=1 Tax=Vagococcus elongatus TaxID=180344 RepID=A0A430AL88_9ENTE|nr:lactonase family protein [Vagococcus elongatus]RSU08892.1 hypothetical protein CBF29_12945 [Vagococcus elongatus]